ncbi:MAG: sugar ABC transporter permease, partial [Mycoplasmataceae bacterium]|nr:sugar ABC transporter permease [Mycoplasmataceae bacterium]
MLTIIVFSVFIPYGFGVYNIQGNGIIGLIELSWITETDPFYGDKFSDSRYALVEGVIGLLLLIFSFIYLFSNSIMTFKMVRGMESGIRQNTWMETKKTLRSQGFPYAISMPGWILISFIVIMPIIVSILLAFTNIGTDHEPGAGQETNWVGFDNFITLFTNSAFFEPLANVFLWNLIWAISTTFLVIVIGTVMAVIIESKHIKGKVVWRLIFMLPWAIPAFVSILFYKVIFDSSSSGFINTVLVDWGITTSAIDWVKDQTMSRMILILIQGWLGHSYILLLVTGNMKSISGDVYEAASIDGANKLKQFWKITIPIILIQIAPLLI